MNEILTSDFYLHAETVSRLHEDLRRVKARYGDDSEQADGVRAHIRSVEDTMIDIGGQLGRMKRGN